MSGISIRRARTPDVPAIHDLIELYAGDRILLAKERVQLYEDVQDFWVADEGGRVAQMSLDRAQFSMTTPPEVFGKLNGEVNAVLAEPEMKQRLVELGGAPLMQTPEAFGDNIKAETEKWKKVVEFAGLKVE